MTGEMWVMLAVGFASGFAGGYGLAAGIRIGKLRDHEPPHQRHRPTKEPRRHLVSRTVLRRPR